MKMCQRASTVLLLIASAGVAAGEEVREYVEGGTRYRETRQVVRRPVSETRIQQRERTIYREQLTHEYRDTYRVYRSPVTEYRWETRMEGLFNPFVGPHLVQRLVPRTRWETRTEVVQAPVLRRELVPVTQVEQVPVTTRRIVDEEVIRRVAIGRTDDTDPFSSNGNAQVARRARIGGTRLSSDPPRRGNATSWRPAPNAVLR